MLGCAQLLPPITAMHILLIEDNPLIGDGLRAGLTQAGHRVTWLRDGLQARRAFDRSDLDFVILDLGLPGRHGIDILREAREAGCALPVLILTASDTVPDRVAGLDAGADDYLVKPFSLEELTARVRAISRRAGPSNVLIRYCDLELDPRAHRLSRAGQPVDLTGRELVILEALLVQPGKAVSRRRIEELLYGFDGRVESNALEVHIHHLRRKLGADLIRTLRGVGYLIPAEAP